MDIIRVSNLKKNYKSNIAVNCVTLNVPQGAVYGLIGLNGAGKTTLIKAITGLIKKFEGSVEIAGVKWGRTGYRNNFAFLTEQFSPHRYLTGWEYLAFMWKLRGVPPDKQKAVAVCNEFGFDVALLDKKTGEYSKGTVQMLGIIQAVCSSAQLLIMDEPTAGLDPLARAKFKTGIAGINNAGHSVFLSTHILHDIDTLCTHIGILHRGQLLFNGTPAYLKERHGTENLEAAFLTEIGAAA